MESHSIPCILRHAFSCSNTCEIDVFLWNSQTLILEQSECLERVGVWRGLEGVDEDRFRVSVAPREKALVILIGPAARCYCFFHGT